MVAACSLLCLSPTPFHSDSFEIFALQVAGSEAALLSLKKPEMFNAEL